VLFEVGTGGPAGLAEPALAEPERVLQTEASYEAEIEL
jgi:hypothetical protein